MIKASYSQIDTSVTRAVHAQAIIDISIKEFSQLRAFIIHRNSSKSINSLKDLSSVPVLATQLQTSLLSYSARKNIIAAGMGIHFKFSTITIALLCTTVAVHIIPGANAQRGRRQRPFNEQEIAESNGLFKFWLGTNYIPITTPREYDVFALQVPSRERDGNYYNCKY